MLQAVDGFCPARQEGKVVSKRRMAPMRGRGGTPNEAANLLKRESGFKFHIFDQVRGEA